MFVNKAADYDRFRLNPRKHDSQERRELFVEKLQDQGFETNVSTLWVRGIMNNH